MTETRPSPYNRYAVAALLVPLAGFALALLLNLDYHTRPLVYVPLVAGAILTIVATVIASVQMVKYKQRGLVFLLCGLVMLFFSVMPSMLLIGGRDGLTATEAAQYTYPPSQNYETIPIERLIKESDPATNISAREQFINVEGYVVGISLNSLYCGHGFIECNNRDKVFIYVTPNEEIINNGLAASFDMFNGGLLKVGEKYRFSIKITTVVIPWPSSGRYTRTELVGYSSLGPNPLQK